MWKYVRLVEGFIVPERDVLDSESNSHRRFFVDLFINTNYCMLRCDSFNDYTYVSSRGISVVDYCLCPYEQLRCCSDFRVMRSNSLVDLTDYYQQPLTSLQIQLEPI